MFIQENSLQVACDQDEQFIGREVMWKATVITVSAPTGPLGESCKEAGVGRLGIDLKLLIKGRRQETFPSSWWCSGWAGCSAVVATGTKILLWEEEQAENL